MIFPERSWSTACNKSVIISLYAIKTGWLELVGSSLYIRARCQRKRYTTTERRARTVDSVNGRLGKRNGSRGVGTRSGQIKDYKNCYSQLSCLTFSSRWESEASTECGRYAGRWQLDSKTKTSLRYLLATTTLKIKVYLQLFGRESSYHLIVAILGPNMRPLLTNT